jgi:hypothetical protein
MSNDTATVQGLSARFIQAEPQERDWSEGYGESWDFVEAVECDECGEVIVAYNHAQGTHDEHADTECTGYISAEGPMMNYLYPLDGGVAADELAEAVVDYPLCVITDGYGETLGLALTGGGMDLSWEIAGAYVAAGFLPPIHFADLPRMAGYTLTDERRAILDAMAESLAVVGRQVAYRAERLAELRESMTVQS